MPTPPKPHTGKLRPSDSGSSGQPKTLEAVIRKEEEDRAQYLAKKLGMSYVNLLTFPVESDALRLLDEEKAKSAKTAPIQKRGKELVAAVLNPSDPETRRAIAELKDLGYTVRVVVVSETSLEKAWEYYLSIRKTKGQKKYIAGKIEIDPARLDAYQKKILGIGDLQALLMQTAPAETTELVEIIIAGALKNFASDIHLEAAETKTRLRYRIDGVLQDAATLSGKMYALILSRIKLLSGLKINIRDVSQDGRFSIGLAKNLNIEVRTSVLPGPYGENVVMRVLNPRTIALSLEDLGMRPEAYALVARELDRTTGMVLTTGPTGSGKTTTLYAFIKKENTSDVKIITIEDPIEYHLEGIEQTQVAPDKGYTFATGLRAIIRQDPDIILVGEIRDYETADIATHSALTGHLVFATLHTNDAAGAIPRLVNMGVNPVVLAPALNVVIAQRLVRKVCTSCGKREKPSKDTLKKLQEELQRMPRGISHPSLDENLHLSSPAGCVACNNTGYKGRVGIFEVFQVDDEMEKFVLQSPSIAEITERAVKNGMVTMKQDGYLKALEGVTTVDEVDRVVG